MSPLLLPLYSSGAAFDKVFELIGDFNEDYAVDSADYVAWQYYYSLYNGLPDGPNRPADADDDGDIDQCDDDYRVTQYGEELFLLFA